MNSSWIRISINAINRIFKLGQSLNLKLNILVFINKQIVDGVNNNNTLSLTIYNSAVTIQVSTRFEYLSHLRILFHKPDHNRIIQGYCIQSISR